MIASLLPPSTSNYCFSSVQSLSRVRLSVTPWTAAHQAFLSITNSRSLLKLVSTKLVMPSNHLILCFPLLPLPSSFPESGSFPRSQLFASGGQRIGSFSHSISPSNEYSELISFRVDWLDLLAVQGTLKSLLQHTVQKHQLNYCLSTFNEDPYLTEQCSSFRCCMAFIISKCLPWTPVQLAFYVPSLSTLCLRCEVK